MTTAMSDLRTIAAKLQKRRRLAGWKEAEPRPRQRMTFAEVWRSCWQYPTVTLLLLIELVGLIWVSLFLVGWAFQ
jgi:hypothetical protein